MSYNNPVPVAVAVIRVNTPSGMRLVGMTRGTEPSVGGLTFPCGYVEPLESAEEAAARETEEELGLALSPELFQVFATRTNTENRMLIFAMYQEVLDMSVFEKFTPTTEALEMLPISAACELAFPLHEKIKQKVYSMFAA